MNTIRFAIKMVLLILLVAISFIATSADADTTIGGVAGEDNLQITVYDDGRIGLYRHNSGVWYPQVFAGSSKGSQIRINNIGYAMGYFSAANTAALVSNALIGGGNNHIRAIWTAGGMQITLDLLYNTGDLFYTLQWTLQNISGATLSDIRFFHGQDTFFNNSDVGSGFWDPVNKAIGVEKCSNNGSPPCQLVRMSLQSATYYAYESQNYGSVYNNIGLGALTGTVDANITDNGYALEWRNASMVNGAVWTITAFEKMADVSVGNVLVTAPTITDCSAGTSCDLTFTVQNLTGAPAPLGLSTQVDLAGWTAALPGGTNVTIPASGSQQVIVRVSVPSGTAADTLGQVTLSANDGTVVASDTGSVHVLVNTHTYTVTKSAGGSITSSPAGLTCLAAATSCTGQLPVDQTVKLSIKPLPGKRVLSVTVNGVNLGAVKAVTLKNLKKPPVIVVTFSP